MVDLAILRKELLLDPQGFGYRKMTIEQITQAINGKNFYETKLGDGKENDFTNLKVSKSMALFIMAGTQNVKKSRAELLFGMLVSETDVAEAYPLSWVQNEP